MGRSLSLGIGVIGAKPTPGGSDSQNGHSAPTAWQRRARTGALADFAKLGYYSLKELISRTMYAAVHARRRPSHVPAINVDEIYCRLGPNRSDRRRRAIPKGINSPSFRYLFCFWRLQPTAHAVWYWADNHIDAPKQVNQFIKQTRLVASQPLHHHRLSELPLGLSGNHRSRRSQALFDSIDSRRLLYANRVFTGCSSTEDS